MHRQALPDSTVLIAQSWPHRRRPRLPSYRHRTFDCQLGRKRALRSEVSQDLGTVILFIPVYHRLPFHSCSPVHSFSSARRRLPSAVQSARCRILWRHRISSWLLNIRCCILPTLGAHALDPLSHCPPTAKLMHPLLSTPQKCTRPSCTVDPASQTSAGASKAPRYIDASQAIPRDFLPFGHRNGIRHSFPSVVSGLVIAATVHVSVLLPFSTLWRRYARSRCPDLAAAWSTIHHREGDGACGESFKPGHFYDPFITLASLSFSEPHQSHGLCVVTTRWYHVMPHGPAVGPRQHVHLPSLDRKRLLTSLFTVPKTRHGGALEPKIIGHRNPYLKPDDTRDRAMPRFEVGPDSS